MNSPRKSNANKKLCKLGKFYIDNNLEKTDQELADYLDIPIEKIRKYKDQVKKKEEERLEAEKAAELEARKTETNDAVTIRADDLMIKKPKYNVVIMTPEASQLGDESRKRTRLSEKVSKNVTQIRPKR